MVGGHRRFEQHAVVQRASVQPPERGRSTLLVLVGRLRFSRYPLPRGLSDQSDSHDSRRVCVPFGGAYVYSASSFHPGGANFAFADGSVRFLKDTINSWKLNSDGTVAGLSQDANGFYHLVPGTQLGVYQALSTRGGGEVVGSDSYRAISTATRLRPGAGVTPTRSSSRVQEFGDRPPPPWPRIASCGPRDDKNRAFG